MVDCPASSCLQPSPLEGKGGAQRRMRGLFRHLTSLTKPLTHHCGPQWSPLSHNGRGLSLNVDDAHYV